MTQEITVCSDGLTELPAIQGLAKTYSLSPKAFAYTFRNIAMPQPHNEAEFVSCCLVAMEHGLNPLTKEIYFMRDKHGKIQAIVSVDGWIKKCNEHPQFDGMEFTAARGSDGKPESMTCSIYRKDRSRPTTITEYFNECVQSRKSDGPWQTHPNRQMRTRTLCQCARIAFGFAGIMDREEFDQWQAVRDVTPAKPELLAVPDIDDKPEAPLEIPPLDDDAPLADPDGFLAKLGEDIRLCDTAEELSGIAESNADLIARLPSDKRLAAARMLQEAAE